MHLVEPGPTYINKWRNNQRSKLEKTGTAVCKVRAHPYFNFHLNTYNYTGWHGQILEKIDHHYDYICVLVSLRLEMSFKHAIWFVGQNVFFSYV